MWKTVKLGDICEIKTGKKDVNEGSANGMYPFFTCAKDHTYSDVYSFDCEAILIAGNGAVGQTSYYKGKFEAYQRTYVLSDFHTILPKLLLFILEGTLMAHLSSRVLGNTIPYIKKGMLENFEFPLPPLAEQQRIVEKLDRAFEEIDRAIEATEESIKKTKSLIDKSLNELTSASGKEVYLSDVCSIESKLVDPKEEPFKSQYHIGAGNILSMSNDVQEIKTAEEEGLISGKFPFNKNHVLYSKIRPYLRKVHLPSFEGICSADIYPLVPDDQLLEREFLFYLLLSERFTDYAMKGSARAGMPKVNREHLFKFKFNLPFIDEQVKLSRVTSKVFDEANNLSAIFMEKISLIAKVKSAILAQELKGPE